MLTLGIDFSADTKKTACCRIDWSARTVELLPRRLSDEQLVQAIAAVDVAAIDVPLGWPNAFVAALDAHRDGLPWPGSIDRDDLRFRRTDIEVRRAGARPLSVSTDKLGVAAMRGARLQRLLNESGLTVDRSGAVGSLVEAYPAAALRAWSLPSISYKEVKNRAALRELSANLLVRCGDVGHAAEQVLDGCDDDEFDAFVCALVARAARIGATPPIPEVDRDAATSEGWIHVPQRPVEEIIAPDARHTGAQA